MRDQLCTMLGIEIPIVQAPMGGAVPVRLAAAVSDAGALGTLPLWRTDVEILRRTLRKMRSLTSRPFAVNLNMEFSQEDRLEVCLEEGVPIISFFWRDPGALVKRAKASGAVVMHTVGTAAGARRAIDGGVDVIVTQGWEAGGHVRGMVATLPLVPAIIDAPATRP
jgi:nitronate monooxygenase